MGAKFGAVKTELILLGLAAAFLGVLLGISAGDRAAAEPVSVTAERALPPEEIKVVLEAIYRFEKEQSGEKEA